VKTAFYSLVIAGTIAASASFGQAPATAPATASGSASATAPREIAPIPAPVAAGDRMEGLAAVYSDKLNGRKTASGQVFSQTKLTAAHPALAFGTKVKVTNSKNGKSVEVVINDRGPRQADRVIDLSRASAAKIGIGPHAMAPVKLEVVGEAPKRKGK
jgi:rare lipoprotein A